eukprot:TRINITY_DN50130_c0_g1_i1.p1 TRINITY_DN50130_c0_g1~~TRINITY_DN50130_c0_g1_i1.p1  ORF type:complete len:508 (+),score=140.52 TRINITY_DN50130_c0_g1_i1:96-1526(+)
MGGQMPDEVPLVEDAEPDAKQQARRVLVTFLLFALCFALNLGTVTASIPLATGQFGDNLGSYSLGTLYALYTVAAMLLSVPLLDKLGTKMALCTGMMLYAVYVASYLIGRQTHDAVRWAVVLTGAAVGGVAAGIVWPAQQGYFTKCAEKHAMLLGHEKSQSTSLMSGYFASIYLGLEVILKLLSSLIQVWACKSSWHGDFITGKCKDNDLKDRGQITVFILYLVLSAASTFLMTIVPMPVADAGEQSQPVDKAEQKAKLLEKSKAAFALMGRNRKILLMSGVNMAFGATAAYLNSYVTGTVIKEGLGDGKVGYFVSIIPLIATVESFPMAKLQQCLGTKVPAMIFGMMCFAGFALPFALVSDPVTDLGKWAILPALFCVFGTGRAVWEGPNKAVMADFFQGPDAQPSGANIVFQNGLTTAVAYYAYPSMSSRLKSWICVGCAAWGCIGYLCAHGVWKSEQSQEEKFDIQDDVEEAT